MKPYWIQTPKFVQRFFPKRVWAFPHSEKNVYLTFDDGPIPEVTPWVLDALKKYKAQATFFCIGDNIEKHPDVFRRVVSEGHTPANHTFNHWNGRKTKSDDYVANIKKAQQTMDALDASDRTLLFRPPYGRLRHHQANAVRKLGFSIVMWDVLSADFDTSISEEKCLQNVLKNIRPGSIVVFHDSLKAEKNLRYALPKVLDYIDRKGWKCEKM